MYSVCAKLSKLTQPNWHYKVIILYTNDIHKAYVVKTPYPSPTPTPTSDQKVIQQEMHNKRNKTSLCVLNYDKKKRLPP